MKKLHLYHSDVLRTAVLYKVPAEAICGRKKVLTPADIDAAKDADRPLCSGCADLLAAEAKKNDVLVRERQGWAEFEKATRPKAATVTYSATYSYTLKRWTGREDE